MENKQTGIFINAFTWGVLLAILLIAYHFLLFSLDLSMASWKSLGEYALMIAVIIFGTNKYRDNILGGNISYGKALGFGVVISLIAALITAVYNYIHLSYVEPDFIEKSLNIIENKLLDGGMPDEQIDAALDVQRKIMKPGIISALVVPSTTLMGFLFSLITSIFTKREPASTF